MVESFKQDFTPSTATKAFITSSDLAERIKLKLEQEDSKRFRVKILNKRINLHEQGEKIVEFIMWSKDLIGAAASLEPHAAIAWAGVSLLLPVRRC